MSHPRKRRERARKLAAKPAQPNGWGTSRIRDTRVLEDWHTTPMSADLLAPRTQHQYGKSCDRGGANYRTSTGFAELDRRLK